MVGSLNNGPHPEPALIYLSSEILLCALRVQPVLFSMLTWQLTRLNSQGEQMDRISTSIHNLVMVIMSMLLCTACSHPPHNVVLRDWSVFQSEVPLYCTICFSTNHVLFWGALTDHLKFCYAYTNVTYVSSSPMLYTHILWSLPRKCFVYNSLWNYLLS